MAMLMRAHMLDGTIRRLTKSAFGRYKQIRGFRIVDPLNIVQIYVPFNPKALRRSKKPILPSVDSLQCGQAEVYERFGAEPHKVVVQGGLTRNEHQPARFSIAKGARVSH